MIAPAMAPTIRLGVEDIDGLMKVDGEGSRMEEVDLDGLAIEDAEAEDVIDGTGDKEAVWTSDVRVRVLKVANDVPMVEVAVGEDKTGSTSEEDEKVPELS